MPKFKFSEIGPAGLAFLQASGSRQPGRYYGAAEALVSFPGSSFGETIQDLDANGFDYGGEHHTLYTFDPDTYVGSAALRAALEDYGDAREAATAARRAKRRG